MSASQSKVSSSYHDALILNAVENKSTFYYIGKRTMDIAGALLGIILLSWVFIIVMLAIKVEDPKGPIFFKQKRIGKNGQEFGMYKFRSMVSDAEERLKNLLDQNETGSIMFKMKNDPRITRVGKFIRKTSIDELPQLWNVVRGEMSLVGPRPPVLREVEQYSEYDKQRLLVTPGCTGLWQVSGRSSIGFKEMVELDLEYIRKCNLGYDILIILKTVKVLFGSKDAY